VIYENENGSQTALFSDYAMIVNPVDNVAVVKQELWPGAEITLPEGRLIKITGVVTPGNRFATRAVPQGDFVRQYGQPIGTSLGISEGDPVSHDNMSNDVPVVRELPMICTQRRRITSRKISARHSAAFAGLMAEWVRAILF